MRQYASSPKKEKSSSSGLANSSAEGLLGRNECSGIHCSLIEQKERKTVSARDQGKREEKVGRTERESDRRKREVEDLLVLPRPTKSVKNSAGFSGKT